MSDTWRIFLSSPSDVAPERERAEKVVRALAADLPGVELQVVRWEDLYYSAASTFQTQIPKPSDCDLVVCVFWKRLGSELPTAFNGPDGNARTGTEYEFEQAIAAAREREPPSPDIFVYRKTAPITYREETLEQERAEKRALDAFWSRWFRNEEGHFLAAFDTFDTTDEFAARFERHLERWIEDRRRKVDWDIATRGAPFRGLEAFDDRHAAVFFGRRRVVEIARARLMAAAEAHYPVLFVLGASGAGKSSLVRAGLVPRLSQPDATQPLVGSWRSLTVTPARLGEDMAAGLAQALYAPGVLPELMDGDYRDPSALALLLSTNPELGVTPIRGALDRWSAALVRSEGFTAPPVTGLLLVVDQIEELFQRPPTVRHHFAALLDALLRSGRIWLVATMRSDFYETLQGDPDLLRLKQRGRDLDLPPPAAADVRDIVEGPARAAGLTYERDDRRDLAELLEAEGAVPGALPMLQYALLSLYELREPATGLMRLADYDRLGGAAGALAARAEAVYARLTPEVQAAFPAVIRALVTVDLVAEQRGATARTTPIDDFPDGTPARALVEALLEQRLLTAFDRSGDRFGALVRVVHESLFDRWPRAAQQIATDRRDLDTRARLEQAAELWEAALPQDKPQRLLRDLPLAEGADLAHRWQGTLAPTLTAFIAASERAARARGRRAWALAGVTMASLAVLAGAATWFGLEATAERRRAEESLEIAVQTVDDLVKRLALEFRYEEGVRADLVRRLLDRGKDQLDRLERLEQSKKSAEFRLKTLDSRANTLTELSTTLLVVGDGAGALAAAQAALAARERLAEAEPAKVDRQLDVAVAHSQISDVMIQQGQLEEALSSYTAARAIIEKLLLTDQANPRWQRALSVMHNKMGGVYQAKGQLDTALANYQAGLSLIGRLAASEPSNYMWSRDLSITHNLVGDVQRQQGQFDAALASYRQGAEIIRRLLEAEPGKALWREDLAASYQRIGDALQSQERFQDALESYRQVLELMERLAWMDPTNAAWQRGLAVARGKIGDALRGQGDRPGALASYRERLKIVETLAEKDPANGIWQRDLAGSHYRIAEVLQEQAKPDEALTSYREAHRLSLRLAESDPSNAEWQRDLWVTCQKIAQLLDEAGSPEAKSYWDQVLHILSELEKGGAYLSPEDRDLLKDLRAKTKS